MGQWNGSISNFSQLPSTAWSSLTKKKKKIQREARCHAYMGFPDTISLPFLEKGARQTVGG